MKDTFIGGIIARYSTSLDPKMIHYVISVYYDHLMATSSDKIAYRDIVFYKVTSPFANGSLTYLLVLREVV